MQKRGRRRTSLEAWLNSVVTPVYLVDSKRRIRFFNVGCVKLTGWPASEVLGKICEYHSEDEGVAQFLGTLCPAPSVFAGAGATVTVSLTHRDGRTVTCRQEFQPLLNETGAVEGVLVTLAKWDPPRMIAAPTPTQQLHAELAALRQTLRRRFGQKTFVGSESSLKRIQSQMQLAQNSTASVWISGESGSGKEHLARLIHYESKLQDRAFVPLDCVRTPAYDLKRTWKRVVDSIQESEAAFGGATPGTVYLMDADATPRDIQQLIVDFFDLQMNAERPLTLRLTAASKFSPEELRDSEEILPEFLDLMTALTLRLPPLRQRLADLPLLAQHVLENSNRGEEKQIEGFDPAVMRLFEQYQWPGNLRELETVVLEARAHCTGPRIMEADLPFRFRTGFAAQAESPATMELSQPLDEFLEEVERQHITRALEIARYNKSKAAELLGIPRPKLYRRMEQLKIEDREDK